MPTVTNGKDSPIIDPLILHPHCYNTSIGLKNSRISSIYTSSFRTINGGKNNCYDNDHKKATIDPIFSIGLKLLNSKISSDKSFYLNDSNLQDHQNLSYNQSVRQYHRDSSPYNSNDPQDHLNFSHYNRSVRRDHRDSSQYTFNDQQDRLNLSHYNHSIRQDCQNSSHHNHSVRRDHRDLSQYNFNDQQDRLNLSHYNYSIRQDHHNLSHHNQGVRQDRRDSSQYNSNDQQDHLNSSHYNRSVWQDHRDLSQCNSNDQQDHLNSSHYNHSVRRAHNNSSQYNFNDQQDHLNSSHYNPDVQEVCSKSFQHFNNDQEGGQNSLQDNQLVRRGHSDLSPDYCNTEHDCSDGHLHIRLQFCPVDSNHVSQRPGDIHPSPLRLCDDGRTSERVHDLRHSSLHPSYEDTYSQSNATKHTNDLSPYLSQQFNRKLNVLEECDIDGDLPTKTSTKKHISHQNGGDSIIYLNKRNQIDRYDDKKKGDVILSDNESEDVDCDNLDALFLLPSDESCDNGSPHIKSPKVLRSGLKKDSQFIKSQTQDHKTSYSKSDVHPTESGSKTNPTMKNFDTKSIRSSSRIPINKLLHETVCRKTRQSKKRCSAPTSSKNDFDKMCSIDESRNTIGHPGILGDQNVSTKTDLSQNKKIIKKRKTLKSMKACRTSLRDFNTNYIDDVYESTPLRNRRHELNQLKSSEDKVCDDIFFGDKLPFDTPKDNGTPAIRILRKPVSVTKTPNDQVNEFANPESDFQVSDRYVLQLQEPFSKLHPVSKPSSFQTEKLLSHTNTRLPLRVSSPDNDVNSDDSMEKDEYFTEQ